MSVALRIPAIETGAEKRVAALRHVVDDAYAAGLFDYPAFLAFLDALDHPDRPQARRLALHELVRHHEDWCNDDGSGVHEVRLLRSAFAPLCDADLWESLCEEWAAIDEGAPKTGRAWHFADCARSNVDVLLDQAVGIGGAR